MQTSAGWWGPYRFWCLVICRVPAAPPALLLALAWRVPEHFFALFVCLPRFLFFPFKSPWPLSQSVGLLQEKMIRSDWCRMCVEFLAYAWGKETVSWSQKMRQINGQYGRVLSTQLTKENLNSNTELWTSWDQCLKTDSFGLSFCTSARMKETQAHKALGFHFSAHL